MKAASYSGMPLTPHQHGSMNSLLLHATSYTEST
jgi:hypothetical protein